MKWGTGMPFQQKLEKFFRKQPGEARRRPEPKEKAAKRKLLSDKMKKDDSSDEEPQSSTRNKRKNRSRDLVSSSPSDGDGAHPPAHQDLFLQRLLSLKGKKKLHSRFCCTSFD